MLCVSVSPFLSMCIYRPSSVLIGVFQRQRLGLLTDIRFLLFAHRPRLASPRSTPPCNSIIYAPAALYTKIALNVYLISPASLSLSLGPLKHRSRRIYSFLSPYLYLFSSLSYLSTYRTRSIHGHSYLFFPFYDFLPSFSYLSPHTYITYLPKSQGESTPCAFGLHPSHPPNSRHRGSVPVCLCPAPDLPPTRHNDPPIPPHGTWRLAGNSAQGTALG